MLKRTLTTFRYDTEFRYTFFNNVDRSLKVCQKQVQFSVELFDADTCPKKIIISHREFEDLPFVPLVQWRIHRPSASRILDSGSASHSPSSSTSSVDFLCQSFLLRGQVVYQLVKFSLFGTYCNDYPRIKSFSVTGCHPSCLSLTIFEVNQ